MYDRASFCVMSCAFWAMLRFAFGRVMSPDGPSVVVRGGGEPRVGLHVHGGQPGRALPPPGGHNADFGCGGCDFVSDGEL